MDSYWLDLRYALRSFRSQPGFTVTVVLTLALGLGACTTVFSLINALVLRPVPGVPNADGLLVIHTDEGDGPGASSYTDFAEFRESTQTFASLAVFKPRPMDLGLGRTARRITGLMVSGSYFQTLGLSPSVGRFLPSEIDASNALDSTLDPALVVIGHDLWQRDFGGSRDIVGSRVTLNGRDFTVVGVAPPDFLGTRVDTLPDVFVPMALQPFFMPSSGNLLDRPGWTGLWIFGRLAEGSDARAAQAEISLLGERLRQEHPSTHASRHFVVADFGETTLPPSQREMTLRMGGLLMACMALFLLVACVNVANLLLARSARRTKELAMRQALGAGRGRIVRQLLIESSVLSVAGCAGALLLAAWSRDAFRLLPLPALDTSIDARVTVFSLGLALFTALGFGLLPAWRSAAIDSSVLRAGRSSPGKSGTLRAGGVFVVLQVAASVVLLLVAGLFLRTLVNLTSADLGLNAENVLLARLDPALQRYQGERLVSFYEQVLERTEAIPGVVAASITSARPGGVEGDSMGYFLDGVTAEAARDDGRPDGVFGISLVGVDYFRTVHIPLRAGRTFTGADGASGAPVIVLNETGARVVEAKTGRPALGTRISVVGRGGPWAEVVGVVGDSKTGSLRADTGPYAYASHAQLAPQGFDWPMSVVARTEIPPLSVLPVLRDSIRQLDPNLPTTDATTLEEYVFGEALMVERLTTWTLGLAGLLALALAAVGLFGVVSYSVSRRVPEIGIRRALGARSGELVSLVVRQGMKLVAVGLVVGLAAGLVAGRAMNAFLYGLTGSDPLTLAVVAILLGGVALLACWLPARRAALIDPMRTLRAD